MPRWRRCSRRPACGTLSPGGPGGSTAVQAAARTQHCRWASAAGPAWRCFKGGGLRGCCCTAGKAPGQFAQAGPPALPPRAPRPVAPPACLPAGFRLTCAASAKGAMRTTFCTSEPSKTGWRPAPAGRACMTVRALLCGCPCQQHCTGSCPCQQRCTCSCPRQQHCTCSCPRARGAGSCDGSSPPFGSISRRPPPCHPDLQAWCGTTA